MYLDFTPWRGANETHAYGWAKHLVAYDANEIGKWVMGTLVAWKVGSWQYYQRRRRALAAKRRLAARASQAGRVKRRRVTFADPWLGRCRCELKQTLKAL